MKSPTKTSQQQLLSSCRSQNDLHMLYSMLPKEFTLFPKNEFKKTKDFYRPEEFIWNNPHRTCDRMYKYYHQGVQNYKTLKEPKIAQQQQQDRDARQMHRIISLSRKRQQARFRFHSKQLQRISLENKSGLNRKNSTQLLSSSYLNSQLSTNNQPQNQQPSTLRRSNSQSLKNYSKSKFLLTCSNKTKPQLISNNQKSYLASVSNFDLKNKAILATIKQSQKEMKDKIREDFLKQKENNSLLNDSKSDLNQGKLQKSTLNNKNTTFKLKFAKLSKPRVSKSNLDYQRC